MVKNCENCGKFHTNKTYCSRECQHEGYTNKVTLTCERCGDEFEEVPAREERASFCSWECRENQEHIECPECGEMFSDKESHASERKYCSMECMSEGYKLPEAVRKRSNYGPLWHGRRLEALARDSWKCQECGMDQNECRERYDTGLHVHHIVPYREFDSDEEAHRLDNLVTLCPPCHREEEMSDS